MLLIVAQANFAILAIFSLAETYVAGAEALEDSFAAALVYEVDHGIGFGTQIAFGYSDLVCRELFSSGGWSSLISCFSVEETVLPR